MRKETINEFTEGLLSDLNPINTPKTVLTDNLNGTIITYNGNEFSLQNDMGNLPLKFCKLNPNFIPVGLKEYSDILYIVSYNPLNDNVEIGSYPSPLIISEESFNSNKENIGSIIYYNILKPEDGNSITSYTELYKKERMIVFNGDDLKLNPGDKYHIKQTDFTDRFPFETYEFFVLDENTNLHEIDVELKNTDPIVDEDYTYVSWKIPGWITLKSRLATLTHNNINVLAFYAPKQDDGSRTAYYNLNLQLGIEDPILLKENIFRNHLKWRVDIAIDGITNTTDYEYVYPNSDFQGETDWFQDKIRVWTKISGQIEKLNDKSVVKITTTPILHDTVNIDGEEIYYEIVYDNLIQERIFDLNQIDSKNWTFGKKLYKYYHDKENKNQIIEFDIDGPLVTSDLMQFKYSVKTTNGNIWTAEKSLTMDVGIGNNIISFPLKTVLNPRIVNPGGGSTLPDISQESEIYDQNEDILILEFIFESALHKIKTKRYLISTQVLNGTEQYMVYDKEMSLDDLVKKYIDSVNINKPIVKYNKTDQYWALTEQIYTQSEAVHSFMNEELPYYTFVSDIEGFANQKISGRVGGFVNINCEITPQINRINGPLWNSILSGKFEYKDLSKISNFVELNGKSFFNKFNDNLSIFGYKDYSGTASVGVETFNFAKIDSKKLTDLAKNVTLDITYDYNLGHKYKFSGDIELEGEGEVFMIGKKIASIFENTLFEECPYIFLTINVFNGIQETDWPAYGSYGKCNRFIVFPPGINPETNGYYEYLSNVIVGNKMALEMSTLLNYLTLINPLEKQHSVTSFYLSNKEFDAKCTSLYEIKTIACVNEDWTYSGNKIINNVTINPDCVFQNCIMLKNKDYMKKQVFTYAPDLDYLLEDRINTRINDIFNNHSKETCYKQYSKWVDSEFYKNIIKGVRDESSGIYCTDLENKNACYLADMLNTSFKNYKTTGKYLTKLNTDVDERYVFLFEYELFTSLGLYTKYLPFVNHESNYESGTES